MKASFNSIGRGLKKLFSLRGSKTKSTPIPAATPMHEKKKENDEDERRYISKRSKSAYGIKMSYIYYHKAASKANKVRRRRRLNKIGRKSRQVNYRIAA